MIAGGHSLLPMMKLRLATPEYLVDINDLHDSLSYIEADGDVVRIGAMTRHRELLESELLWDLFPIFRDAERVIADPPVRNRGTLGGALCQADPSEDLSSVCTTLDAVCVIQGSSGTREVTMDEFHRGPYETAVGHAELLTEVRIPVRRPGSSAYLKVDRRAGDWAVVAAGAAIWLEDGLIADARVGLAAVGPEHHRHPRGVRRPARTSPRRRGVRRGRPARRRELPSGDRRSRVGGLQATPGRRADPSYPAHGRRPGARRHQQWHQDGVGRGGVGDRQRRAGHPRRRGPDAAGPLPARRARADRHALGLRHHQLRRLRRPVRRRAGEVVHRAGARWRRDTTSRPSSTSRWTECSTRCSAGSWSATGCSAASARRGCC